MMLALCWAQKCFPAACAEKHTLSRSVATPLREWPVLAQSQRRAPACLGAGGETSLASRMGPLIQGMPASAAETSSQLPKSCTPWLKVDWPALAT